MSDDLETLNATFEGLKGKVQVFNQRQPISTSGNEATAWASVVKGVMEMAERVRVRKEGGV